MEHLRQTGADVHNKLCRIINQIRKLRIKKEELPLTVLAACLLTLLFAYLQNTVYPVQIEWYDTPLKNCTTVYPSQEFTPVAINAVFTEDGTFFPTREDPQLLIQMEHEQTVQTIEIEFSEPQTESCILQIYYAGAGQPLSEERLLVSTIEYGIEKKTIKIPSGLYNQIRLDINGTAKIKAIRFSPDLSKRLIKVDGTFTSYSVFYALLFLVFIFFNLGFILRTIVAKTLFIAIGINIYLNIFYRLSQLHSLDDFISAALHPNLLGILFTFFIIYGIVYYSKKYNFPLSNWLYIHRWTISLIILITCVALGINGSSVHVWASYIDTTENGVLFGTARPIRSDEWATLPVTKALEYENYPLYSNLLRATETETVMTSGKIVWDISAIFRPVTWGYLLFGFSYGTSFSWCFRLIMLFMVSFDLAMLITKNHKLALSFACAMTLAPCTQWWGQFEMPLYSFGAVLAGRKYLLSKTLQKKLWYALLVIICAGALFMILYPAWIIPYAYISLGLMAWIIIEENSAFSFSVKRDIPIIVCSIVLLVGLILYLFIRSYPAIHDMMNTAYPGTTRQSAPMSIDYYFRCFFSLFSCFTEKYILPNHCEMSDFVSFFPLGIILSVFAMFRQRKKDILSIILICLGIFFGACTFFDIPLILRKITLMNFVPSARCFVIFSLVQFILLFRSVSLLKKDVRWFFALPLAMFFTWALGKTILNTINAPGLTIKILTYSIIFLVAYYAIRAGGKEVFKSTFAVIMIIVGFMGGGFVNPIQRGMDEIEKSPLVEDLKTITEEDPTGKWIVTDIGYPYNNLPLMAKAPTLNCVNFYPNLELWQQFENDGNSEQIYNRYAVQILTTLQSERETTFLLGSSADWYQIDLNVNDLSKLGISYVLTYNNLDGMESEEVYFDRILTHGDFRVYKVHYKYIVN